MLTSIIHMADETRLEETGVDEMSIRRNRIKTNWDQPQCAYKDGRFEPTRFTASPHSRCQFEGTSSRKVVFQIPNDRCQHFCQRKRSPCKHGSGEGYRAQKPG